MKKWIVLAFWLLGGTYACSPTINYLGKSYSPTTKIDLYFDERDITRDYEVMGNMRNAGYEIDMDDLESIKEAMIKKAREEGGDAILFLGSYYEKTTSTTTEYENTETGGIETSTPNTTKIVEAKLLKYKRPN